MQSNICKINSSMKDLDAILRESEKVAVYNELTHKQTLQLRLLCEEIDGLLPNLIEDFEGNLWIDYENGVCKVNVSVLISELNADKKSELIGIAKNKKNAAAVGIVGKIRNSIENFFLNDETMRAFDVSAANNQATSGYMDGIDYSYLWSLEQYRTTVKQEARAEDWDELEKSVIASAADDIIVGIKGTRADIVIVKKFA